MQLSGYPDNHLTYCTNIHPGESWEEVSEQLEIHLPELKNRVAPDRSMGIGLRLSATAAEELLQDDHLKSFKDWLQQNDLYVFTMNGFPYGSFHRQRVKDLVYAPDWRTDARVRYTRVLIHLITELLPEGAEGGISTSPISYKRWLKQPELRKNTFRTGSRNLALLAYEMTKIKAEEGKTIHLDIEPEPDCLIENSAETIDFYNRYLIPVGSAFLDERFGLSSGEAEDLLREHIRVCYDTCHFAVEYEDPGKAIRSLKNAGIRIGKTQISAALKVELNQPDVTRHQISKKLSKYDEPTYLHQVVERQRKGGFVQYRDLPDALTSIQKTDAEEWRIHFHVPIFADRFDLMRSTRDDIVESMGVLLEETDCHHYEIETYTWEVLPENLKDDITGSIEREFEWVFENVVKRQM